MIYLLCKIYCLPYDLLKNLFKFKRYFSKTVATLSDVAYAVAMARALKLARGRRNLGQRTQKFLSSKIFNLIRLDFWHFDFISSCYSSLRICLFVVLFDFLKEVKGFTLLSNNRNNLSTVSQCEHVYKLDFSLDVLASVLYIKYYIVFSEKLLDR